METDCAVMSNEVNDRDGVDESSIPEERLEDFRELASVARRNADLRSRLRSPQTVSEIVRQIVREMLFSKSDASRHRGESRAHR